MLTTLTVRKFIVLAQQGVVKGAPHAHTQLLMANVDNRSLIMDRYIGYPCLLDYPSPTHVTCFISSVLLMS